MQNEHGDAHLVCAHEKDYNGKGSFVVSSWDNFTALTDEKKIEKLNDMIVALINHVEVKQNIEFKDYQR